MKPMHTIANETIIRFTTTLFKLRLCADKKQKREYDALAARMMIILNNINDPDFIAVKASLVPILAKLGENPNLYPTVVNGAIADFRDTVSGKNAPEYFRLISHIRSRI
jgi:hypothetical protein